MRPFGRDPAIGHFGGRWTLEVEAAALEAMIDFAEQALPPAFGADVRRRLRAAATTAGCGEPRMAGYSCALPGQAPLCARFAEPHGERVLCAGEPRSCEH